MDPLPCASQHSSSVGSTLLRPWDSWPLHPDVWGASTRWKAGAGARRCGQARVLPPGGLSLRALWAPSARSIPVTSQASLSPSVLGLVTPALPAALGFGKN